MSHPPRLPEDQRVRDTVKGTLDRSYLLEASAGTGKTTVLVDRVLEILKTELPLERIAVITFTEKAAGELKTRLRARMESMLGQAGMTHSWRDYIRRSIESLDRASVGTIHSFAASLLRERPVEADVDPRFTVADGLTATMLMEETWDAWIERETAARAEPLSRALRLGATMKHLRQLAFRIAEHPDVPLAPSPGEGVSLADARDRLVEAIAGMTKLSSSCLRRDDRGLLQIRDLEAAVESLKEASGLRLLKLLDRINLSRNAGARKDWNPPSDLDKVKAIIESIHDLLEEVLPRARTLVAHTVADWIRAGFLSAYREAKESRRLLDFSDLLVICRRMLVESKAARAAFQQRFASILVDEFQDTDPLQTEILFLLAADDPGDTDWRRTRPRPGSLFMVGDPKQSIYRFRRADIELYEEIKSLMPGAGGPMALTQNFRTVPSIARWINALFGGLIRPSGDDAYQPHYEPIAPFREEPPARRGSGGTSRVMLVMPHDRGALDNARAETVRKEEARHAVAFIGKAVAESWPVQEKGPDPRPLKYRDVGLLFRTSTAFEIYEEILREREIPYRLTGGKRYYLRSEIQGLQAVLDAVDRPYDKLAVVSALRSPFFGHSDEELLGHTIERRSWVFTRAGAGEGTPFDRSFELLARLHEARNGRPISATLEDLFEHTGALALFYLKPDGEQRAANLVKTLDLARTHERLGGYTFGSFVRWLAGMAAEEREEAEAPLVEDAEVKTSEGESDAVRILTVHRAKGLEFPMVLLCDVSGGIRREKPPCIVERGEEGARMEFSFAAGKFSSGGYKEAHERERARLDAEEARLFYVAATRARDYLVIPAFSGREAGIYLTMRKAGFIPELPSADGEPREHRGARLIAGADLDTSRGAVRPLRILAEEAVESDRTLQIKKEAWSQALTLALEKPTMGRAFRSPTGMEQEPDPRRSGPPRRDATVARAVGRAVHAVLERIDLATGRDIGVLSEEAAAEQGRPDLAAAVRDLVDRALRAPIVKEALASPRLHREMPFAIAGDTWISEGRVDMVFESGGALTVVDFKTDDVSTEAEISARLETYRPQALLYGRAMAQVAGLPVRNVVFHFIRPGVQRSLAVDERFLAEAASLLEKGSAQARI